MSQPDPQAAATRLWPWRTASMVALVGAAGLVAMAVAWKGTANTVRVERQVDWVPLGVAGASAATLAMVGWVLAGRRCVAERVTRLAMLVRSSPAAATGSPAVGGAEADTALVATDRMVRYHRATCPLVAGKATRAQERSAHEAAGRRACGMCEP